MLSVAAPVNELVLFDLLRTPDCCTQVDWDEAEANDVVVFRSTEWLLWVEFSKSSSRWSSRLSHSLSRKGELRTVRTDTAVVIFAASWPLKISRISERAMILLEEMLDDSLNWYASMTQLFKIIFLESDIFLDFRLDFVPLLKAKGWMVSKMGDLQFYARLFPKFPIMRLVQYFLATVRIALGGVK